MLKQKLVESLRRMLVTILLLHLGLCCFLYFFQANLILIPYSLPDDYKFSFQLQHEELKLEGDAGVVISAIHFNDPKNKSVVFYFNGNGGRLRDVGPFAASLNKRGLNLLAYDYRHYGKSKGKLTEEGLYQDASTIYTWLERHYQGEQILVHGASFGTGLASYIASTRKVAGLILEAPYYSIADVAKRKYPFVPVDFLLKFRFPVYSYLSQVKAPVLIIHGTADRLIPYASGDKLREYLKPGDSFATLTDLGHLNFADHPIYVREMDLFLIRALKKAN